jgi:4-amino-4-deoxy-L-arabinose transferase-like glycosyltransferase
MADPSGKDQKRKPRTGGKPVSGKPASGRTDPRLRHLKDFVVEEIELRSVAPTGPQTKHRGPARWRAPLKIGLAALGLALVAIVAGLVGRGPWPGDETRFLAIAWEMWAGGDLLVPRFNGAPASVAPLYAWSVHLGWLVFDAAAWWARLVPALYMLLSLFLAARIARLLWPGQTEVARYLPFVLLGGFYWVWSATWFTPDFLTVFFTLFALHALLWMWRARDLRVWMVLAIALGLGLLAGGSLILLYVLPVALLAPLWTRGTPTMPWGYWYVDLVKATLVGFALFAAWAVPFAARAGVDALLPLITAPIASHALELFPAARPWWWYLFLLPLLGFPWTLWPLPWLRFWDVRRQPIGNGLAFCMLWAVSTIAILSLFPVRQPQLLLPLVPAFFLAVGWVLLDEQHARHDHSRLASTMIFPLMLAGAALAVVPKLPRVEFLPEALWQLSPWIGVAVIGVGVAVGWLPIPALRTRVLNMAVTVVAVFALAVLAIGWQLNERYDVNAAAQVIANAQRAGQPVAHVGPYHGQYHFAGRLRNALDVITPDEAPAWAAAHPDGLIVSYTNGWQPRVPAGLPPAHEQPYDEFSLRIWSSAALAGG